MHRLFAMLFYFRTCVIRRKHLGVTFIELMVTLSLILVLLALAWPRWSALIASSEDARLKQALFQTISQLRLAGLNAGVTVVLCPSHDGVKCETQWSAGWLAYRDVVGDHAYRGERDKLFFAPSGATQQMITWVNLYHNNILFFEPSGFMSNGRFTCTRHGQAVWTLVVSNLGNVR